MNINMSKVDKKFMDFDVGECITFDKIFTIDDFELFSRISGDSNPLHHDNKYSSKSEFKEPIVPMHLVASPLSYIAGMIFPGHRSLYLSTKYKSILPVKYGVEITYSAKIVSKNDINKTLSIRVIVFNNRSVFLDSEMLVKVRDDDTNHTFSKSNLSHINYCNTNGNIAFITGSTGEIGREIALSLAQKKFDLILNFNRSKEKALNLMKKCKTYGINVHLLQGDLSNNLEVESLSQNIENLNINNSILHIIHAASPSIDSDISNLMRVNFSSLKKIFGVLCKHMLSFQSGSVTFIGSSALQYNPTGWENYTAAKAASTQYMSQINKEYEQYGVIARVLAPGLVLTSFSKKYRLDNQSFLLPEQIGEIVANGLTSNWEASDKYIWVESNQTKKGSFGFINNSSKDISEGVINTLNHHDDKTTNVTKDNTLLNRLDVLLRDFFQIDNSVNLIDTGIDLIPGWDSLKHIELMVMIESKFNIKFKSEEIERTTTYTGLIDLLNEKINVT